MTGPVAVTDWVAVMGDVAVALLGEPNAALSSERELRYGRRGSLAVHRGVEPTYLPAQGAGAAA